MDIQTIRGAVARGWCHDPNRNKEMDSDLAEAISQEIAAFLFIEGQQLAAYQRDGGTTF